MPTIKDVAEQANVSVATVSHVINGTRYVSDELKERVLDAMTSLGYHPNRLARSLRMGQTKTIGLLIPDNSNPFFAETARYIEDIGYNQGYSVILCNSDDDIAKENAYIDVLVTKQVDGVVLVSSGSSDETLQKLQDRKIAFVVVDRDIPGLHADVVLLDNRTGGYLAVQHLLQLGHRRIACIAGPSRFLPSAQRVEGYRQSLIEAGITVRPELIISGDFHIEGGKSAMNQLLDLVELPTAVFVCNDLMAIGAIQSIYQRGLDIPKDISIIGFDDIPYAQVVHPPLTTIAQPMAEITRNVMDLLLQRMNSKGSSSNGNMTHQKVITQPRLVVRKSTAPAEVR